MSTDTGSKFRDALVGLMAPDLNSTAVGIVDGILTSSCHYVAGIAADAATSTTSNVCVDAATPFQFRVTSFSIAVNANVTTDNTNNATINLVYNNGNGGSDTLIATAVTANAGAANAAGALNVGTPRSISLQAANVVVPNGSHILVKITKNGGGGLSLPVTYFDIKGKPT